MAGRQQEHSGGGSPLYINHRWNYLPLHHWTLTLKHFISFLTSDQKLWWQKSPNLSQHGARATSFLRRSSLSWAGAPRSSTSTPQPSVNPRQQGLLLHLSSPWAPLVPFPPISFCNHGGGWDHWGYARSWEVLSLLRPKACPTSGNLRRAHERCGGL